MKSRRLLILICFCLATLSAMAQDWKVLFSANGGFYDDVFPLEMFSTYPQGHIRYTTNGNRPTAQSRLYTEPLMLDSLLYSESNIYTIVNTIPSIFYLADSIQHAIVIRAAVFDENDSCVGPVTTQSYFIHALGCDFHGLPVLSIAADSLSLFDYETGIFVPGVHYDWTDSIGTGNYKQKGREWERLINVEFYEPDNQGINQECGLRAHGGASRFYQQKGMKLYAREEYGKKRFSHRFFTSTSVTKFKHLCLHPFRCSSWRQTGSQEYVSQTIASNLDFEALAVREAIVFINGEYWGIYTIEESPDERYLEDHFDADLEKVNMIKYWGVPYYGDPTDWRSLFVWMQTADLSQPEDSAYAYERIDISCFIDYMLFESFLANIDWPQNNVKIWQPEAGSRFRWIFYDGDGCFVYPDFNATEHALNAGLSGMVFSHFIENEGFVDAFRERYYQLHETYFSYDYMKSVKDKYKQLVEAEIPAQSGRFHYPSKPDNWYEHMEMIDEFMRTRDSYFRNELAEYFLSVEEYGEDFSCYPNPFSDEIRIRIDKGNVCADEINIYDLLGRKVFSMPCLCESETNEIMLRPNLAPGVYALSIGGQTCRIVKIHK